MTKIIADYGSGHRESGLAAGREPEYHVESDDGQREPMEGFGGVFGNVDAFKAGDFVTEPEEILKTVVGTRVDHETITSVAAMQLRAASLFSEMIQGKITGYRVEMDRIGHPATFHITTWKAAGTGTTPAPELAVRTEPQEIPQTIVIADGMIAMPNLEYYCSCLDDVYHRGWYCEKCKKPVR